MKTVFTTGPYRTPVTTLGRGKPASCEPVSAPGFPTDLLPPRLTARLLEAVRGESGVIEEIRLRAGRRASLTVGGRNLMTEAVLEGEELSAILTRMCGGSLYAYSQSIREGYLTLPDGVRVGVVGRAVCEEGRIIGVCEITGLSIRLPHRHGHMGRSICRLLRELNQGRSAPRGVLIYAPPGEGKTTLLRAVAAGLSGEDGQPPLRTVVVDTRGELGFEIGGRGLCLDILRGYPRAQGVEIATRILSAQVIICDELGDTRDITSLVSSHHGGVPLVASAHGGSPEELLGTAGLRLLHEAGLFGAYVGIRRNGLGGFTYCVTSRAEADTLLRVMGEQGGSPAPEVIHGL